MKVLKDLVFKGGGSRLPRNFEVCHNSIRPRDFVKTPHDKLSKYSPGKCGSDGAHILASGGASKRTSSTLQPTAKCDLRGCATTLGANPTVFLGLALAAKESSWHLVSPINRVCAYHLRSQSYDGKYFQNFRLRPVEISAVVVCNSKLRCWHNGRQ